MAELSAYAPAVDSKRIAERVALNYVGEKIGKTLGGGKQTPQGATYITGTGSLSGSIVFGPGSSAYRAAPPVPVAPPPPPKFGVLRTIIHHKPALPPKPAIKALGIPDLGRPPTTIFNEALASQAKGFRNYEPTGMRLVMENWTPKAKPNNEIRDFWNAAVVKFYEMRVQELAAAADAVEERWVDEGLRHPPLGGIQKVHVRPNMIGSLPPRIAYDPDRE